LSTHLHKRERGFKDSRQLKTEKKNRQKILSLLQLRGNLTISEAASELHFTRRTVRKYFQRLQQEGFIDKEGRRYKYSLKIYFEADPFDKKVIEAISQSGSQRTFLEVARNVGRAYVATKTLSENKTLWGIIDPLLTQFFYDNPFWLREIFRYALREKLIDEKYFSGEKRLTELSGVELKKTWSSLFKKTEVYAVVFAVNPQKLLEWLKTEGGKKHLERALPQKTRIELYHENLKLRKDREEWDKRLRSLSPEKHFENEGKQK